MREERQTEARERLIITAGKTDLTLRWCADTRSAGFKRLPFLSRLAWRLRIIADRLDDRALKPERVRSYALQGHVPAFIDKDQWDDAMCFGLSAIATYFNDLEIEAQVGKRREIDG